MRLDEGPNVVKGKNSYPRGLGRGDADRATRWWAAIPLTKKLILVRIDPDRLIYLAESERHAADPKPVEELTLGDFVSLGDLARESREHAAVAGAAG